MKKGIPKEGKVFRKKVGKKDYEKGQKTNPEERMGPRKKPPDYEDCR